jgi:hypothetical protein
MRELGAYDSDGWWRPVLTPEYFEGEPDCLWMRAGYPKPCDPDKAPVCAVCAAKEK